MKNAKEKQRKIEYERIVKIVKDAEKEAERFIRKSKAYDSNPQPKYL